MVKEKNSHAMAWIDLLNQQVAQRVSELTLGSEVEGSSPAVAEVLF